MDSVLSGTSVSKVKYSTERLECMSDVKDNTTVTTVAESLEDQNSCESNCEGKVFLPRLMAFSSQES